MGGQRGRMMWKLAFMAVIWVIWKERYCRCFGEKSLNPNQLVDKVRTTVASWTIPLPQFRNIPVDTILRNWKKGGFLIPISGAHHSFLDGSLSKAAGLGGLMCECEGSVLFSYSFMG